MRYERPEIKSYTAAEIVELMGPVQGYGDARNDLPDLMRMSPVGGVDMAKN